LPGVSRAAAWKIQGRGQISLIGSPFLGIILHPFAD
jgi:hypothetical protein